MNVLFAAATYEDFVTDLKEAAKNRQCRYAIYDAQYTTKTTTKNKIIFFYWWVVCSQCSALLHTSFRP